MSRLESTTQQLLPHQDVSPASNMSRDTGRDDASQITNQTIYPAHPAPSDISEWTQLSNSYDHIPPDESSDSTQRQTQKKISASSPGHQNQPTNLYTPQVFRSHPRPPHSCHKGWWKEFLWGLLSFAFLVGIIITLFNINGMLLSTWTSKIALSPNTVISTLSTLGKAAMMLPVGESISQLKWLHKQTDAARPMHMQSFDDASRGPLGSVTFFWKGRKYGTLGLLTYVGCILTIAAVALDPFAQQVISFPSNQTELDAEALVRRSQVYDYGNKGWRGGLQPDITRDPLLSQASISGVYDQVYSPPFSCSVTNCTYPEFTTLGICSHCTDVTSEVTRSCEKYSSGTLLWGSSTRCNFTTPSGFHITAFDSLSGPGQSSHTLVNTSIADLDRNISTIMHLGLAFFNTTEYDAENGFDQNWMDALQAYECVFSLCANVLTDWAITNGTLRPGNTSSSPLTLLSSEAEGYAGHSTFIVPDDNEFPGNRTFVVNFIDQSGLYNALFNVLAPSSSRDGFTSGMTIANALTQVLFTRPDIPATLQNMATGMSNVMMSGPNSELVNGKAYGDEVYIQVNWPWLALSVVLEVIMAAFLASTVYQTHKAGQYAWKSSLLPLIEGHHFGNKSEVAVLREDDLDRDSLEMTEFSNGNGQPPSQTRRVDQ